MNKNFQKGDRVWTLEGWGTISKVYQRDKSPYFVRLDTEGVFYFGEHELFFHELTIPPSAKTRPYELKEGDPVIVWDDGDSPAERVLQIFVRRDFGGKFATQSVNGLDYVWDNCVPYDRTLLGFPPDSY